MAKAEVTLLGGPENGRRVEVDVYAGHLPWHVGVSGASYLPSPDGSSVFVHWQEASRGWDRAQRERQVSRP